ncbi:MAG: alpha/beta fold hydrolase [Planctomycetota bacterium]
MPSVIPAAVRDWIAASGFGSVRVDTPDGALHALNAGPHDAPAMLFVHGNPTWSYHWRAMVASLAQTHRCVAVDHLGCGASDRPGRLLRLADRIDHLRRLVDELDLTRVTLVAQDWGGAIGLGAMLDRVDRLERVLLFNTGAFPPPFIPWRINVCRTPALGRIALQGMNLFSLAALRMTLARRERLEPDVAAMYLAPYDSWANRRAVYGFVDDIPTKPSHPTWGVLERIERRLPTLGGLPIRLVWGMRDWCFTPACLDRLLGQWPHAEAVRLADVGHWVVEDAPEEALTQLRDFVGVDASRMTGAPA